MHSQDGRIANHTTSQCYNWGEIEKIKLASKGKDKDGDKAGDKDGEEGFGKDAGSFHTFTGIPNNREKKMLSRAICHVATDVPRWLNWSEHRITWSRDDQPSWCECPGRVALVVRPRVKGFWLSKTLMDGGCSINILYYETFQRIGLKTSDLIPTSTTFHGIVPGRKAFPIGRVVLEVAFGDESNFRKERVPFEVVTYKSAYHCVLGRQAFAKFMAVPHYAYNKLKMPGPRGIIIVSGDAEKAVECEKKGAKKPRPSLRPKQPPSSPS